MNDASVAPPGLGTDDLADALWLTAATQYAWARRPKIGNAGAPNEQSSTETGQDPEQSHPEGRSGRGNRPPVEQGSVERGDEGVGAEQDDDLDSEAIQPRLSARHSSEPLERSQGAWASPLSTARTRIRAAGPDIFRALRPFKRRAASPRAEDELLDEEATAEQAAEDGLWLPITRPSTTRWLDLTLVVDTSPSMTLWRSTVNGVVTSLERLGAFRSIQRRLLDTRRTPRLRGGTADTPVRSPSELIDPSGRRVVLVLTDGVGACWRRGLISPLLAEWGESMSVAVAHVLPQRLWPRGGLRPHRAKVSAPHSVAPNRQWRVELPDAWLDPEPVPANALAVPILELKTRWLSRWARLVTGDRRRATDGMVMFARGKEPLLAEAEPSGHAVDADDHSARQQVRNFLSTASPPAFRLITLLAAVPVSVPVARVVQAELVPDSGPDHVAEVFTSGLLRSAEPDEHGWETATFDFDREVREILLSGARRSETAHVVRLVADVFADTLASQLRDALEDPDAAPTPGAWPGAAGNLEIEQVVMRALSGPYLPRADRLGPPRSQEENSQSKATRSVEVEDYSSVTSRSDTLGSAITTVSETMSEQSTESANAPQSSPHHPESFQSWDVSSGGVDGVIDTKAPSTPPSAVADRILRERQEDDVPPIWGDVPPRNPIFTGREDSLADLDSRLTAGGATAILPAALHGMGGIGKTQIAVEYIYRHLQDYDLVWWVQATQSSQIRADLTQLAQALRLPGSSEANTAVPAVREALRRGYPIRRWLLVFDAADSPEIVRPFFPANGPGDVIITSRNPDWAEVARPLEVALFERAESKELLRGRGPEITDEEANALAEKLGDLPLAIAQAASWRTETGMPVSEYLRVFDEKVAEILDVSASNDYEVSLAAAWNVSFDQLELRSPAAYQLLQVCAFFAAEPISRSLFTGVRGTAISPELDAALRDPIRLGRAIRDINRFGLAKIDHRNNTLQLHRLVQLVLRDRMSRQRVADMRHGAHVLLANLDPNDPSAPFQWPRYHAILPHAYASGVLECDDPWVRQLVIDLMEYLYFWGDHEEAAALAQRAIDVWSVTLEENDPQLLHVMGRSGFYLWTLGRYAHAGEINERTLRLRQQTFGDDGEETLVAELSVAFDLKAQGEFQAAREMNEHTLDKARGLFGEDDPVTLRAAHDVAVSLRLVGDYRRARELDEDTYRRRVEVHGFDSAAAINTFAGLALDRLELGDYSWAHAELERLAERTRALFGEDKAITLQRQHQLSIATRKNGDHQRAFELSGQALERFRFRYDADHPKTLSCALARSIDLRHAGDLHGSRTLSEDTFERYRRSLGEHHPHTVSSAVDLAVTLRLSGDAAGARQLDERSLQQFRTSLGADQPSALVTAINLASDVAALGEIDTAVTLGTEATERAHRVLGADHPTTLAAAHNLVLDRRAAGHTDTLESTHADVLTRYRRALGESHPAVIAAAQGIRANCDRDPAPL